MWSPGPTRPGGSPIGTTGGPRLLNEFTLHQVIGYNLLVISILIGLRLLFMIFRNQRS